MKLQHINISNVLGVQSALIDISRPVTFIAGANGAGKSSIAEAIRHALTGETVRVDLKKEYAALLHGEAEAGTISLEWEGGGSTLSLPGGSRETSGLPDSPALPFLIDTQRFASLDEAERRAFLFKLMGVKVTPAVVKERLITRGIAADKAERVVPLLVSGFEAAQKEAQAKARDAKAAWRTITGETYGEKKAEGWKAEAGNAFSLKATAALKADELTEIDAQIEQANQKLGAIQAEAASASGKAEELAQLRAKAGMIERITRKLETDRAELQNWKLKVEETEKAAHGIRGSATACKCPECDAELIFSQGRLVPHGEQQGDEEAAVKLPEYKRALDLFQNSVKNGERDLAAAQAAAEALPAAEAKAQAAPDEETLLKARDAVAMLKDERKTKAAALEEVRGMLRAAESAADKTAKATEAHADVAAWSAIADALAPEGIPSDFLADAIRPFNASLAELSDMAQWPSVQITADMQIEAGGRAYRFRSESEKWRADAIIAAAIGKASGLRFLILDRFDVLDAQGRSDCLYWLDDIATSGIIESAVVLGTLKAIPGGLPATFQPEWIESGRIAAKEVRAAA